MPAEPLTQELPSPWRGSVRDLATALREDAGVRSRLTALLAELPARAVFWETAPSRGQSAGATPFRHVVVRSDRLAGIAPDPGAFSAHFRGQPTVTVPNLSGDARLVIPEPVPGAAGFPHLLAFLRNAPEARIHALWQAVGAALEARWADHPQRPVWLSTAGLGVPWLHVRLDDRPKYYRHAPFRAAP